jgi:hypothetical protein
MDPQLKSILTTILAGAFASVGTYAVSKGIIPAGDQATLVNDLVGAVLYGITAFIGWIKMRQHTPAAQIAAVNNAPNGVKVVDERAPEPKVTAPLK